MLDKSTRDGLLQDLRTQVQTYVKRERERLVTERDFLQGVLDRTANRAADPYNRVTIEAALASVKDLVGMDG